MPRVLHFSAFHSTQQDSELQSRFTAELALYIVPANILVFVDKTGTDRRDSLHKKAYSVRGNPLRAQKLLVRGEPISVIVAISLQGLEVLLMLIFITLLFVAQTLMGKMSIAWLFKTTVPYTMCKK